MRLVLKAAPRPNEALNGIGKHEQIRLTIGRKVIDYLLRRDGNPFVLDPGVPTIRWILLVARFDLEAGLDCIGDTATKTGFLIALKSEMFASLHDMGPDDTVAGQ